MVLWAFPGLSEPASWWVTGSDTHLPVGKPMLLLTLLMGVDVFSMGGNLPISIKIRNTYAF